MLSNQMCDSASEDPAGSFLKETTTEHMTGALRQLFFPWRSKLSPAYTAEQSWIPSRGHRVARLSLAEEKEQGEEREGGREGEEVEEKNEGGAQPSIMNSLGSASAALSTPTLRGAA